MERCNNCRERHFNLIHCWICNRDNCEDCIKKIDRGEYDFTYCQINICRDCYEEKDIKLLLGLPQETKNYLLKQLTNY